MINEIRVFHHYSTTKRSENTKYNFPEFYILKYEGFRLKIRFLKCKYSLLKLPIHIHSRYNKCTTGSRISKIVFDCKYIHSNETISLNETISPNEIISPNETISPMDNFDFNLSNYIKELIKYIPKFLKEYKLNIKSNEDLIKYYLLIDESYEIILNGLLFNSKNLTNSMNSTLGYNESHIILLKLYIANKKYIKDKNNERDIIVKNILKNRKSICELILDIKSDSCKIIFIKELINFISYKKYKGIVDGFKSRKYKVYLYLLFSEHLIKKSYEENVNSTDFNINSTDFNINSTDFNINSTAFNINSTVFNINSTDFNINSTAFNINSTAFNIDGNKIDGSKIDGNKIDGYLQLSILYLNEAYKHTISNSLRNSILFKIFSLPIEINNILYKYYTDKYFTDKHSLPNIEYLIRDGNEVIDIKIESGNYIFKQKDTINNLEYNPIVRESRIFIDKLKILNKKKIYIKYIKFIDKNNIDKNNIDKNNIDKNNIDKNNIDKNNIYYICDINSSDDVIYIDFLYNIKTINEVEINYIKNNTEIFYHDNYSGVFFIKDFNLIKLNIPRSNISFKYKNNGLYLNIDEKRNNIIEIEPINFKLKTINKEHKIVSLENEKNECFEYFKFVRIVNEIYREIYEYKI